MIYDVYFILPEGDEVWHSQHVTDKQADDMSEWLNSRLDVPSYYRLRTPEEEADVIATSRLR